MRQRRDLLGAAGLAALLLCLSACGDKAKPKAQTEASSPSSGDQAQDEATQLGSDMAGVLDRVLAYAAANSGRAPATIAEIGMDSLTPKLVRRVERQGRDLVVTVGFRRPSGRAVTSCQGTNRMLEDISVQGHYELTCTVAGGGTRTFTIEPGVAPPK